MKTGFRHVVMVVYDGIENSVFESQVVAPLLQELEADQNLEVTLISFERTMPTSSLLCKKIPAHDRLHLVLAKRLPFFGTISLQFALWQLIKILRITGGTELRARGPLAGWLVLHVTQKLASVDIILRGLVPPVLIQARGLAAQEHEYAAKRSWRGPLRSVKDWVVQKLLHRLEAEVYGYRGIIADTKRFTIEVVSHALKDYLVAEFRADQRSIVLATRDITPRLDAERVALWRIKKRKELGLSQNAQVYVYSGSFKPWQCAKETITEAAKILEQNPQAFFLVLSGDVEQFYAAIKATKIDVARCLVTCVPSSRLTEYLAVADVGFLLRESHVINWVSRPTKMLEYQAVGLEILHNNTIGCLAKGR